MNLDTYEVAKKLERMLAKVRYGSAGIRVKMHDGRVQDVNYTLESNHRGANIPWKKESDQDNAIAAKNTESSDA